MFDRPTDKWSIASMTDTLLGIGKRHWRSFLPIWLFPIAFLLTLTLPGFSSHSRKYFLFLDFPAMVICGYVALKPGRSGGITFAKMFFLVCHRAILNLGIDDFGFLRIGDSRGRCSARVTHEQAVRIP
jgi:hypothetical protein